MDRLGKSVIVVGVLVVVAGIIIWLLGDKLRFLGRLPGDIRIERENFRLYIPITTMVLASLLLTFIMWLIQRFGK
jgi:hypothetical protein